MFCDYKKLMKKRKDPKERKDVVSTTSVVCNVSKHLICIRYFPLQFVVGNLCRPNGKQSRMFFKLLLLSDTIMGHCATVEAVAVYAHCQREREGEGERIVCIDATKAVAGSAAGQCATNNNSCFLLIPTTTSNQLAGLCFPILVFIYF